MLVATLWLAVLAATPEVVAWTSTGSALALLVGLFLAYGRARVGVVDGHLVAGRARVPLHFVGEVRALDAEEMRRVAGRDADARAYLLLRPYLKRGVRAELTDPDDPTPYWLLACRRPDALVAAVETARADAARSGDTAG